MIRYVAALSGAVCLALVPLAAQAYIGPGAGASLAGSLLAVLAAIATAVAIILFWPLRLLYKKLRGNGRSGVDDIAVASPDNQESTSPGAAE